jgi:hypothetical protein
MVFESRIAFDGRTAHVAAVLPKTHQLSAKGFVRKAGEESLSKPRFAEPLLRCNRGLAKKTTLRAEWTSDDGMGERFFDCVTLSHLRQGRRCGHLALLRPEDDNQELTRRCATTRLGSDATFRKPILRGFGCRMGFRSVAAFQSFRGAGSLLDRLGGYRSGLLGELLERYFLKDTRACRVPNTCR